MNEESKNKIIKTRSSIDFKGDPIIVLNAIGEEQLLMAANSLLNDPMLKMAAKGEYPVCEFNVGENVYVLNVVAEIKDIETELPSPLMITKKSELVFDGDQYWYVAKNLTVWSYLASIDCEYDKTYQSMCHKSKESAIAFVMKKGQGIKPEDITVYGTMGDHSL